MPEDSRDTWPAPSISEPSQCVFEVRVVAMRCFSFAFAGAVWAAGAAAASLADQWTMDK
jgi:hypothetical protein